ncbi:MAG: 4Fe-4S binding protein, partial [Candidatus Odinarchaeia archaeon]
MATVTVKSYKKDTYKYPFGKLLKDVIRTERCTLCGGCIAACPINC